jgi:hypothetical protein
VNARPVAAVAVLAAVTLMSGCFGSPGPVETTPAFPSEEEAFAAAEETYRAYVDALNQVDLSDPETFEPVFALTTGDANAAAKQSLSQMHADRWEVGGQSEVVWVKPGTRNDDDAVSIDICVDVSAVTLTGADGASQVAPDRPDRQQMVVQVESLGHSSPVIRSFSGSDPGEDCL